MSTLPAKEFDRGNTIFGYLRRRDCQAGTGRQSVWPKLLPMSPELPQWRDYAEAAHSSVEWTIIQAGFETPTRAATLRKGQTLAIPGDTPMRAVVTGTARRHVLAVIVHDSAQPPTMRMEEGTGPRLVACK